MLLNAASHLETIENGEQLWTAALAAFAEAGFSCVIYLVSGAGRDRVTLRTNIPRLYENAAPAGDPFLQYCCNNYDATLTGAAFLPDYDYLPEAARQMITAARNVGFNSGLGIPVRLQGSERFGGFNLGTPLERAAFEAAYRDQIPGIQAFCLILHRRLEELLATDQTALAALSPRERQVLDLVIKGKSRKECAAALGLSAHTVAGYVKSAYRKLGVRNRAEAALVSRGEAL